MELAGLRSGGDVLHHPRDRPWILRRPSHTESFPGSEVRSCDPRTENHRERHRVLREELDRCDHPNSISSVNICPGWVTGLCVHANIHNPTKANIVQVYMGTLGQKCVRIFPTDPEV